MLTRDLEQDSDLVCQAGATWDSINATLEEKDIALFFPVRLPFYSDSETHDDTAGPRAWSNDWRDGRNWLLRE
jgi:hypothetical protein